MIGFLPILGEIGLATRLAAAAAFFGGLAANILGFFAKIVSRGLAINLTVLTLVIGLTLVVIAAVGGLAFGLSHVVPPYINVAASMVVPDNAIPCISTLYSARVIRWVWQWQYYAIIKVTS